jgi:tetratricopeptide (TPR) repeat protein
MSLPSSKRAGAAPRPGDVAVALHERGDYAGAVQAFERILQQDPANAAARWGLGRALIKLKQMPRAVPHLEQAVAAQPKAPEPHYDLALAYLAVQRPADAVAHLTLALARQPQWIEALSLLGFALHQEGQPAEAEATLRRALALRPNHPETLNHLGLVAMRAPGRIEEATRHFTSALAVQPALLEAWNNLGTALMKQNRLDEALSAYRRALALDPKFSKCKFNESLVRLLQGRLDREAWLKYEYRWVVLRESPARGFKQPLWRGEPLAGRTILLHTEQGLGDTLQMVRYAPLLAAQGATVLLEVQPALRPVLEGLPGVTRLVSAGETLPPFDLQCPLLSLPFACDTRLDTIPAPVPYVRAPAERIDHWSPRLRNRGGYRVGVVWRGNPKHHNDANRSVPFAIFQRLFDRAPCEFISLQYGPNDTEAAVLAAHPATSLPDGPVTDFADTAAIVAQLDLVVTVDTSVAHLAGAMGKPVWVLLPFAPDWRWMLHRPDSPWYPTMRLFRQPAVNDWSPVLDAVGAELQRAASHHAATGVHVLKSA